MEDKKLFVVLLFTVILGFVSCGKEDPVVPNEEELITTLNYTLTPMDGGDAVTLSLKDLDGDGGDDPVITGATLSANQTYSGVIELLNETESPAENISDEVAEEHEEHQFFFQTTNSKVTIEYNDQDTDGNPVGLSTTLMTGAAGTTSLTITLRHEPNKSAAGVADGEIANAGGETDIEVTFSINVL